MRSVGTIGGEARVEAVLGIRKRLRDGDPGLSQPWRTDRDEECLDRLDAALEIVESSKDELVPWQRRQIHLAESTTATSSSRRSDGAAGTDHRALAL